jgi:PAS domain S-box-containing protein
MKFRVNILFQNTIFRYLFAIAAVASVFGLRIWLIPFTGTGAPFVLFFAAVLVTSLLAGVGPGICAVLLSIPLAAYTFVVGAGYPVFQAAFQSLLFSVDGIVVVYLTFLMKRHQGAEHANRQLRGALADEQMARRQAESACEQMRESEEKYQVLLDSIDEGFCVVEVLFDGADNALDYRFLEVNRVFEKQTGISNAIGRRMREIAPAHEEHWFQISGQVALTGESRRFERPAAALGRFYDAYAFRLGRPEQRQVAILFNDITERKRAEQALRRSEAQYRGLIEHMPDGVFAYQNRRIVYANDAFVRLLGHDDRTALVGRSVFELLHPDDHPAVAERIRTVLQTGLPGPPKEFRMIGRDGSFRIVETVGLQAEFEGQSSIVVIVRDLTVRKRAEEAVRAVSEELHQTLHIAGAGLTHCSRDLRYLSANPAYSGMVGLPVEQIVGMPMIDVLGQAAFEIIRPSIERVLSGERVEFEDELPLAGERKWIHADYTPDRDASGNVVGWVASVMDITERKRIEEELKAANAFLDAIIENIPLMLFIKEGQSLRFVRFNRAGEDLLGWSRQMLIGKSDYDFWPKEQAEFFVEKDRESMKSGAVVDTPEEPILTRYRGVRILHTRKVPILDTAGNPIYLLGISEDITERRRIEKEQQFLAEVNAALSSSLEYEQTLATLAQLIAENIADWSVVDVIDEQGQVSRVKVASADPNQAALCAVLEQMPPDRDLPHLLRSVMESKQSVVVEQVTLRYIESLSQGPAHLQALEAMRVISLVAVPLLLRGQPLGALAFASSTPSHVYGQSDLRLAEALADRAAIAIENARLYRASVYATQLRDQVLGVVAHDLRSPLSNILMQISASKRQGPEPERRSQKPLEVIERAAARMNRLIQDLLDVAVMEAGPLTIERAQLSAGGVIVEAVEMQRPLASSSSLELRVEVDPDVPDVLGDRDRLLQVFENLIGNAIKFTKAGGRITAGAAPGDNDVVFWVADTGCGIASENLPRVFDRFWQATRAGRQSAGLGLSITKGIVEAHGGRIWVESTEGRGSTFFFTIPTASAAQDRLSHPRRPDRAA